MQDRVANGKVGGEIFIQKAPFYLELAWLFFGQLFSDHVSPEDVGAAAVDHVNHQRRCFPVDRLMLIFITIANKLRY